ncbi:glucose-6-phosphate isomerase [Candidatus Sulfurimonas marisnigri]|uniref:Glucose-6-phosphate isomerase n=1 Tax=Candidatus Sulfurimonas marisnigri TaxID=2740405 RepID=A0A7S7M0G7_9BACT|nr:glucose-6-phosphate isomerase [Candidatus Sulfurimonas marisnigri]QOY54842.1 glucose-6-phosphate isomerase [Candidatus Sulfurimonas marisnigri]
MLTFQKYFPLEDTPENASIMQSAMAVVKDEMQSNQIGYYKLPSNSLSLLERLKEIDSGVFTQIIIIGIGGSSLGIKAIDSILRPYTPNAKEVLYFENSDPITISETLTKIKKDKAAFFIISKSGSTIETTSILKTVIATCKLDLDGVDRKRVFAITDKDSALSKFAQHHNLKEFNIPDNVGGRFSVLSAVGVVPLQMAGYDVQNILKGAQEFITSFFEGGENHLLEKACYMYINSKNHGINVLFSYADHLEGLTKWYVQLWGESLGKIDFNGNRVGLTPIGLIGSVDQHSFLELIIEGPHDKSVTFISIKDAGNNLKIPDISLYGIEKTDFINNQSFNTLINAQCDATMQSVIQSDIAVDAISFDKVTPGNIGAIIIYYELLTSLMGAMLMINTYNQPGVELGKEILYKNLEKN